MRKTFIVALAVAALGPAAGGSAQAQTAASAIAPAASGVGTPSVDWTVQDLLANPATKAVMVKNIPGIEDDPRLDTVKAMTLRTVAQFPEAQIDQAKLDSIETQLAALKPAA